MVVISNITRVVILHPKREAISKYRFLATILDFKL